MSLDCSFPGAVLRGDEFVGKVSMSLTTHGLYFLGGRTPFSPSTMVSMNGGGRKMSIFNVPAAQGVNFGLELAFWGRCLVGGGYVVFLFYRDVLLLTTYANNFRGSGRVGKNFSSSGGRVSFRGLATPFRPVRSNVCFGVNSINLG